MNQNRYQINPILNDEIEKNQLKIIRVNMSNLQSGS
jgi:hypothetical protein